MCGRILLAFLLLCSLRAHAGHALALGYEPKYPASFSHFDYVDPAAPRDGKIVLSNPDRRTSFDSFNPFILKGTSAAGLNLLVFESLMVSSWDEPASMYPLLAKDATVDADKLGVTFTLDARARYADGTPVTAADVKYSFETLVSSAASPQYRIMLADVASIRAIGRDRVRYRFKRANPELPIIVAGLPVFSPRWVGKTPFDRLALRPPVASGPYRIAEYKDGRLIRYERRQDYWGKDLPSRRGMFNFASITYRYYQDDVAKLESFKAGVFDALVEYSAKNWVRQYQGRRFASGDLLKRKFEHQNTAGMQGFILNTRRPQFQDVRVRRALTLAMDFAWLNRQYFYNEYTQLDSFWANSELAAHGPPTAGEAQLLEPWRSKADPLVWAGAVEPPTTLAPHSLRDNLKLARELLEESGWRYRDGALRNAAGQPFTFEFLDDSGPMLRVFLAYARNLEKLGIQAKPRQVDFALYQKRLEQFDFDMTTLRFGDSQSPGNELRDNFGSKAATTPGSGNFMGVRDPVVDAMVERVIAAEDRATRVTAVRALDRVLRAGAYVVPHWYSANHRVAFDKHLRQPATLPRYYSPEPWMLMTWWRQP
ncbi:extracellular solute-binding protein [Chitinibacteraceae bacterium HSL-7]